MTDIETGQQNLARVTEKAAADIIKAFLCLPDEKRRWSPDEKARSALDMIAECAVLNGYSAEVISVQAWPVHNYEGFPAAKAEAADLEWDKLKNLRERNTERVAAAIRAVPAEDFVKEIQTPWRPMTLSQIMGHPYWNMTYHLGQINYIASILGCLE